MPAAFCVPASSRRGSASGIVSGADSVPDPPSTHVSKLNAGTHDQPARAVRPVQPLVAGEGQQVDVHGRHV